MQLLLINTPDPITQIGLAIPLLILYELSIFSVKFIENKNLEKTMHNLKEIRKDFKTFKELIKNRNVDIDIENLKKLDDLNRELIQKESFEKEKKIFLNQKMKVYLKIKKFQLN